ncbi:MAG: hypothetical protein EOM25_01870 [Deltaproteobacteria bacterium]|nr:hypothetical protein [Deltaproteobacteria bacterium]
MRDDQGIYYYPNAADKRERMYVRESEGSIEFRLWNRDRSEVWDRHGWLDLDLVNRAIRMFREEGRRGPDPSKLYDADLARFVLKEAARN